MKRKTKLKPHSKITMHQAVQAMIRAGVSDPAKFLTDTSGSGDDIKSARLPRKDVKKIKKFLIKDGKAGIQFKGIGPGHTLRVKIFSLNGSASKYDPTKKRGMPSTWVSPFTRPEVLAKGIATRKRNKALKLAGLQA